MKENKKKKNYEIVRNIETAVKKGEADYRNS